MLNLSAETSVEVGESEVSFTISKTK